MDVRELKYFIAVAKFGSFSRASEHLHLSQSTLSKVVKALEDEIGIQLIDRTSRHISLTDAGKLVYSQAQQIVRSIDELSNSLYDIMNLKKGTVSLGIPPIVGTVVLPKVLSKFRGLYPGIQVEMTEVKSKQVEKLVESGEVDLGIIVSEADTKVFETYPFSNETMKFIVNPSHPMASRSEVSLSELRNEPFIMFKRGFYTHDRFREACIQTGFEPIVIAESSHWDFIYEMIAHNQGVAVMPESICVHFKNTKVISIPLINPSIPFNLTMITKKNRHISFAAKEFIRQVLTVYGVFDEAEKEN